MSLHDNPTYNNETMHLYMRSRGLEVENPSPVSDVARLGRVAAMDYVDIHTAAEALLHRDESDD